MQQPNPVIPPAALTPSKSKGEDSAPGSRRWLLLLLLPCAGLIFPQIYARATPALFGFPFFYWYQFAWVLLSSAIMAFVYVKTKD